MIQERAPGDSKIASPIALLTKEPWVQLRHEHRDVAAELLLADAVHQLDPGDRDRGMTELLEAEHHCDTLLAAAMVLLNQVIEVLQPEVDCSAARSVLDRFSEESFGSRCHGFSKSGV
jgi:hypothetical protein